MSMSEPTFLFADLSGFTALTEVHGDEQAADLVADYVEAVRALLTDHGAELVKSIGDAVMIRCERAGDAIRLGVRIVEEVGRQHGFPIIRVGMHTGPAAERDGDWFGATVNLAARIAAVAEADEVVLSDSTREAAGTLEGIMVSERGRHSLRNVSEPVRLFDASCEFSRSVDALPLDPVCRMVVDPDHEAGRLTYEGIEFHFCSLACVQAFAERPERYVGDGEGRGK